MTAMPWDRPSIPRCPRHLDDWKRADSVSSPSNREDRNRCLCADLNYVQVLRGWMAQPLFRAASSMVARS